MAFAHNQSRSPLARLVSIAILVAPAVAFGVLTLRQPTAALAAGAAICLLFAAMLVRHPTVWIPPVGGTVIVLYLLAAGWVWINTRATTDPVALAIRGGLLVIPAIILAGFDLHRTGAGPRRRVGRLCQKLKARCDWPTDARQIYGLPEVQSLRAVVEMESGPVFDLLDDPRPEVRASAFAALQGKRIWRPGEAADLLHAAQRMAEPSVRVIAAATIGEVRDAGTLAGLAGYLRDPHPEVRAAAAAAAVDGTGEKWAYVRDAVRAALTDPKLASDGALPGIGGHLSPVAVCDLTAWACEAEPLGGRAVRTLIDHYARQLQHGNDFDLVIDLGRQVTASDTAAALRVELAQLLRTVGLLTPELLDRMTNADQPGPVRLLAAEALLQHNPHDEDGIDVLRGLGRQPNRELALSIARVIQTCLRQDMGLPPAGVAPKSKEAGEIARRVLAWATNKEAAGPPGSLPSLAPTPDAPMPGLPPRPPTASQLRSAGNIKLW